MSDGAPEAFVAQTPLAKKLAAEIAECGPINIATYMSRCLGDAEHGYYVTKSGIGAAGDFTTAPEISQVFGELIGLWAGVVWQQMGSPSPLDLVEFGPGRGILMADALRAARVVPGFRDAVRLRLCEINPAYQAEQRARLAELGITAQHSDAVGRGIDPSVIVANEFLDTLPARQWRLDPATDGWQERHVGLDETGRLAFTWCPGGPPAGAEALAPSSISGEIYTQLDFDAFIGSAITSGQTPTHARHDQRPDDQQPDDQRSDDQQLDDQRVAMLFIDYGHDRTDWGDTLQAVRRHKAEHPLAAPGEADLSVGVDFAAFRRALEANGMVVDGVMSQAEFLGRLGVAERASRLMSASPAQAGDIEMGVARLMSPTGMGRRFQVIGARSRPVAPLPGFDTVGVDAAPGQLPRS